MVGEYADKPFTQAICHKDGSMHVGIVGQTGEAYKVDYNNHGQGKAVKISDWHPYGLHQKFSASFFKSYTLPHQHHSSGIGHETPQQNQAKFLNGQCFTVPLKAYQVLKKDYHGHWNVEKNVHTDESDYMHDCVAFKTMVAKYR